MRKTNQTRKNKATCQDPGQTSMFVLPPFRESLMSGAIEDSPPETGYSNSPLNSQAIGVLGSEPESQTGIDNFTACWDEADPVRANNRISVLLEGSFDNHASVLYSAVVGVWYTCSSVFGNSVSYKLADDGKWRGRMSITGKGCAVLSEWRFREIFEWLSTRPNLSVTRVDVKADDKRGYLCLEKLSTALRTGGYSGFRSGELIESFGGARAGVTVYFGGRKSELRVRFYDKAAESGVEGAGIRQELQMRGKRAAQWFDHIISNRGERICVYGASLLAGVMVVGERRGKNLDRIVVADFWKKWVESLGATGRREPSVVRKTTISRSLDWLARAASKAMAKAHNVMGNDFAEFIGKMVEFGASKLNNGEIEDMAEDAKVYEQGEFIPFYHNRLCYTGV